MKFLVPTDFSDYAKDALIYAAELQKVFGGSVTFLNVYPHTSISPYVYDELIKSVNEEISTRTVNKLKNEWSKHAGKIMGKGSKDFKVLALEGGIVDNIIKTAKKEKTDMIVMGTKGGGPVKRLLFGSNASNVIEKAPCPVLTIPKLARYKKPAKIVYATGCNKHELDSIKDLITLAKGFDSLVHVVYITDDLKDTSSKALDRMKSLVLKKTDYPKLHFELIQSDDIADALNVYIQLKKINLLALTTKKRSVFNKLFDRSLAKEMAFHLKIPLLAYHR